MIQGGNQLTNEKRKLLKQGTKVEFMWHGNRSLVYTGRIEVKNNTLYWCAEYNYKNDKLTSVGETMQYYNALDSFFFFTSFEILK